MTILVQVKETWLGCKNITQLKNWNKIQNIPIVYATPRLKDVHWIKGNNSFKKKICYSLTREKKLFFNVNIIVNAALSTYNICFQRSTINEKVKLQIQWNLKTETCWKLNLGLRVKHVPANNVPTFKYNVFKMSSHCR